MQPARQHRINHRKTVNRDLDLSAFHGRPDISRCGSDIGVTAHTAGAYRQIKLWHAIPRSLSLFLCEELFILQKVYFAKGELDSISGVEPTHYGHALLKSGVAVFDEMGKGLQQIEFINLPAMRFLRACSKVLASANISASGVTFWGASTNYQRRCSRKALWRGSHEE